MKNSGLHLRVLTWLLLLTGAARHAPGSPRTNLESPSESVRSAAAKILLSTYTPPSREKWDKLLQELDGKQLTQAGVEEIIGPRRCEVLPDQDAGMSFWVYYQLDDRWTLFCSYSTVGRDKQGEPQSKPGSARLANMSLMEILKPVEVDPPPHYTGVWTTYYPNGRIYIRTHYKSGVHNGEETGYYSNGNPNWHGYRDMNRCIKRWTYYTEEGKEIDHVDYGS